MSSSIPPRSTGRPSSTDKPDDESLLDEALEETFPASDPISPSAAEKAERSAAEKEAKARREREAREQVPRSGDERSK